MRNTFKLFKWLMCAVFLGLYGVSGATSADASNAGSHPTESPLVCSSIAGPTVGCVNQLATYMTTPAAGATYAWSVSPGGVLSNTTGPSTLINWTTSGTKYVYLSTTIGGSMTTCSLQVNISPLPTPAILTDFISDCPEDRKENGASHEKEGCWVVCENTTVNYWTTPTTGNTYQWTIVGGTPTTAVGSMVTVTWGPAGTGTVVLTETAPGGCSETKEECVKIVESPVADFLLNNQTPSSPLKICLGETVYFQDMSTGGAYWLWEFGDGATSTLQDPSHQYNNPGTYNGTLTVKNECGCTAVLPFTVLVSNTVSPEIVCISTVCLNDCAYYSLNNLVNCPGAVISWKVYGGGIINNPDAASINIKWDDNDGFIQTNGYGMICVTVTGCPDLCDGTVCVRVPVIHNVKITGDNIVCEGEPVNYTVPIQPGINEPGNPPNGVNFEWIVSAGGTIISTPPYSNTITVIWSGSGTGTVSLKPYQNYLTDGECYFEPEPMDVIIKPTFTVNPATATICVGDSHPFYATGTGFFNWTVSGIGSPTGTFPDDNSFLLTPTVPGTYVVTAASTSGAYCNVTPSGVLEVLPAPPVPTGTLSGPLTVCANTPYSYTLSNMPPPGTVLVWSITGGTLYGSAGQTVTAQWGGGAGMTLSVQTMSTQAPFCMSDPLTFNISNYSAPASFISGVSTACVNETKTFTTALSTLANYTDLQWSVSPLTAGSVVVGQGTNTVDVLFNTSAPSTVQIICTATVCGYPVVDAHDVTITQIPTYTVIANPSPACQGEVVNLSLNSTAGVNTYSWDFGDVTPGSNLPAPTHSWLAAGSYPVTAQLTLNICGNPTVNAATTLDILPLPIVNVTSANGFVLCGSTTSITLVASTQYACDYEWSTSETTSTITVTASGVYTVIATNPLTGCTAVSQVLIVNCGHCNGCTSATPPWTFTSTENCDTYTFTPNTTAATFVYWYFGDQTYNTTGGSGAVTHQYAHPGYYQVWLRSLDPINNCLMTVMQTISVKFKGGFSYTFDCSGGTMQTVLTDRSEYLPGYATTPTWYEVGGGAIGTGSVLSANLSPGVHNVYLSVTIGSQTCTSPVQTIVVPGMPNAYFLHNAPVCEGVPVVFDNLSTGGIINYLWDFGDFATSGVFEPSRTYDAPPNTFSPMLTVFSNWGCSHSYSTTIPITSRGTNPTINMSPTSPQCQGTPINLTAIPGALPIPITYGWYNTVAPLATPLATSVGYSPALSGTYGVNVTDGNGCAYNVLSSQVVYLPPPVVQIVGASDYCLGENIELSANLGSGTGYTYNWTIVGPSGTTSGSGAAITVAGTVAGNYVFTVNIVHTASGCSNSGSFTAVVHAGVTGLTITPSANCEPATLTAFGTGAVSYNWSTGDNAPSTFVTQGGFYSVIATDNWGCTAKATYDLPGRPDLSNIMTGCYEYCEPVEWQAIACAGCTYQWYLNGAAIAGETNPTIQITTSGTYTVEVSNGPGCTSESDPIDISIATNPDLCHKCDVKVLDKFNFTCAGIDPVTGNIIYNFTINVFNGGGALYGLSATSGFGAITITSPNSGYLPGGGAITAISGTFIWNGQSNFECIKFVGNLSLNCEQVEECRFDWCGELPGCCDKPCALKIKEVSAECIGFGYFQLTVVVENYGCDLFNGFIKGNDGIFAVTPSSISAGITTVTAIVPGIVGLNGFALCAYDYKGNRCCAEFQINLPDCKPTECRLEIRDLSLICVGLGSNGKPIYQFSALVGGAQAGSNMIVVPSSGTLNSLGWSWTSAGCQLTGIFTPANSTDAICFDVLSISTDTPPEVCMGTACVELHPCQQAKPMGERNAGNIIATETQGFTLVPNPANDVVNIQLLDPSKGISAIRITDITGRVRLDNHANSGTVLNTQHLPSGVYFVIVTDGKGVSHSEKLIVTRQ